MKHYHCIENENRTSDVTLAIGDCKLFCAHKRVNKTSSNYYLALFLLVKLLNTDMDENVTQVLIMYKIK